MRRWTRGSKWWLFLCRSVLDLKHVRDIWLKVNTGSSKICTEFTRMIPTISSCNLLGLFESIVEVLTWWSKYGKFKVWSNLEAFHHFYLVDYQVQGMFSEGQHWISLPIQYLLRMWTHKGLFWNAFYNIRQSFLSSLLWIFNKILCLALSEYESVWRRL